MCDIYDYPNDCLINENKIDLSANSESIKCKKCSTNGFVVLQRKDVYCGECFYAYCSHKFRSTIGKAKLVRNSERVLIAFSGGLNSAAMIHMINDGLSDTQHKKLRFVPSILYINEDIITDENEELRQRRHKEVIEIMLETKWKCYMSSLEMSYRSHDHIDNNFYINLSQRSSTDISVTFSNDSYRQSLINSFSSIKSLTSKEEFIKRLRYRLVCDIAVNEKFDKVFFANNASRLSAQIISDIAIGKGIQTQSESGFADFRHDIPVLRPMREFTAKELAFYAVLKKCRYVTTRSLTTSLPNKASISKMSESFVTGLEREFPATVYTIFKTGNKLAASDSKHDQQKCIFCDTAIDIKLRAKCSAYEALVLSNVLSKNLSENNANAPTNNGLSNSLCYGCNILSNEMNGIENSNKFPKIIYKKVEEKDIEEFLIDSDDDN